MKPATVRALLLVCVLLVGAIGAAAVALNSRRDVRDDRNCSVDAAYGAVTAVLVDQSDRFTTMDANRIALVQEAALESRAKQTLVMVAVLMDSPVEPVRWIGEHCIDAKPSSGVLAYLNGNPKVQARRWRKRSAAPLMAILHKAAEAAPAEERSFISQALFIISRRPEFAHAQEKRLILFSDMLEFSDTFSTYRKGQTTVERSLGTKPEWKGALDGFRVTVLRAYRPGHSHLNETANAYWKAYARYSGATEWSSR